MTLYFQTLFEDDLAEEGQDNINVQTGVTQQNIPTQATQPQKEDIPRQPTSQPPRSFETRNPAHSNPRQDNITVQRQHIPPAATRLPPTTVNRKEVLSVPRRQVPREHIQQNIPTQATQPQKKHIPRQPTSQPPRSLETRNPAHSNPRQDNITVQKQHIPPAATGLPPTTVDRKEVPNVPPRQVPREHIQPACTQSSQDGITSKHSTGKNYYQPSEQRWLDLWNEINKDKARASKQATCD